MAQPPIEVRIDADDRGLQRGLDRAQGSVRNFAAFARGAFSGIGLGVAGAVAGVLSFQKAIDGAKQAMGEFDALAKRARAAGLSSDFYQVLQLSAEEAGVAQETLNGAMISFVKRVGEAQAGSGALVSIFKKLRPDLLEQIKTTKSQEEAFKLVADAIGSVKDAQQQAALAAAAFNKSGIGMIEMLRNGRKGLDDTAKKARELGLIIDKSLLTNAEQLNNDFGVAIRVIDIHFKKALITIAPYITQAAVFISKMTIELDKFIGRFQAVNQLGLSQLNRQLEEATQDVKRLSDSSNFLLLSESQRKKLLEEAIDREYQLRKAIAERKKAETTITPLSAPLAQSPQAAATKGPAVDELGERFKALQESLKTREQILTEQYERDLALLEVYHEREGTMEEKRVADRLALQERYTAAINAIREKEKQAAFSAIIGGAEQIFSALGVRNKKLLRMAKIFGAAQALVSTMQGAAKALSDPNLPFPANIAAAAAVVAKGIGFVNAIKGTSESGATGGGGGGGGGGGRGSAAAPAATQESQRSTAAVINLSGGDMFSRDQVVGLINSINEAMEDGARLRIA